MMTYAEFETKKAAELQDVHPTLTAILSYIAYENGHSAGYHEVLNILSGLVYQFQPINALLKGK
jgi:hypothetical protein